MSVEVEIPGGKATLYNERSEMTERRRRPATVLRTKLGKRLELIQKAKRLTMDGEVIEERSDETKDGKPIFEGDFEISERDFDSLQRLNDALAWALLKDWTLDQPLPASPDALLDLPGELYDALRVEAAKIFADLEADEQLAEGEEFTVAAVEDTASPTGA